MEQVPCQYCDGTGQVYYHGGEEFCYPCCGTGWVWRETTVEDLLEERKERQGE